MALFKGKKRGDLLRAAADTNPAAGMREAAEGISARDALSLFYFLMAVDGTLHDDEFEKFDAIYRELGGADHINQKVLIHECQAKLDASVSSDNPLISALTCVDEVLYKPSVHDHRDVVVPPRLLVWDLLTIACSDGNCHSSERDLIKHIASIVGVEDSLVLEMESFILTLLDLENEETWIKTTSQPYLVIESVLKDIEARKTAVFDGVKALITQ